MNTRSRLLTALGCLLFVVAGTVPATGQVLQSADLAIARRGHTATLLDDGRVLLVGGNGPSGLVAISELFDPATGTVSAGPSSTPRADHAAVLLPDGRVLISGGRDASGPLGSSEYFDPAGNSFSSGPALARPRAGHTATALADGKILLVGGDAAGSAEIFDPAAGTFRLAAGQLATPRAFHGALLLASGKVLVAGGSAPDNTLLRSAETYNPADETFAGMASKMAVARFLPSLRLLTDGKVQVIGGDDAQTMEMFDADARLFRARVHLPPGADLLQETLTAQTRAALFGTTVRQNPAVAGADEDTLRLLDREDHSLVDGADAETAVVAGGTSSAGQALTSLSVLAGSRATVTTDLTDYRPGQIVTMSGTGWQPGEIIHLILREEPEAYPDLTTTAVADEQGAFVNAVFAPAPGDVGRRFVVTAIGQASGRTAQTAFSDAGLNLDQCQNIDLTHINDPCGTTPGAHPTWDNGNINGSNSEYREADGVPFRLAVTDLANGTWTLRIEYDFTAGGVFVYDRLTRYNLTQAANPCLDTTDVTCTVGLPAFDFPIPGEVATPSATAPALPNSGALDIAGTTSTLGAADTRMTVWVEGGTAVFVSAGQNWTGSQATSFNDGFVFQDGLSTGNSTREFAFKFTVSGCPAEGCNLMIGWSGHLAAASDWGTGKGASSNTGSDFHMRVIGIDTGDGTSGGNQDRSINLGTAIVEPATIIINKVTNPSPDPTNTSFGFTASGGLGAFNLTNGGSQTFNNLTPGSYTVTESTIPTGWTLTNITCVDATGNTTTSGATATINVAAGETVTCTFTNTKQSKIVVDKVTVPAGDPQSFSFTAGGTGYSNFSLTDAADPNQQALAPGAYSVTETVPSGWALTGLTCSSALGTSTTNTTAPPLASITLAAGDTVTCTFTNTRRTGTLIVRKVTVPSPDLTNTSFDFTAGGGLSPTSFSLVNGGEQTFTGVPTGSGYTVSEDLPLPANWFLFSAVCDKGTPANIVVEADQTTTCTFTNIRTIPVGELCDKTAVQSEVTARFKNNKGFDAVVRVDQGQRIQEALDSVTDVNGDKYILVGVTASPTGAPGGHTTQHFEINRNYEWPFGLIGCSVTVHDDELGDGQPTARIASGAGNPLTSPTSGTYKHARIFVMDVHPADSDEAGGIVEGSGRLLRNVQASGSPTGLLVVGSGNTLKNCIATDNLVGVEVTGNNNYLDTCQAHDNTVNGFKLGGSGNTVYRGAAGDKGKGNGGDGILVGGTANIVRESTAYANAGHGIAAAGANHQLLKNIAGDIGKGNGGDGIHAEGTGILAQENRARGNGDDGLDVQGGTQSAPNRLRSNLSNTGSSGSSAENAAAEYRLLNWVSNSGGGNKADNVLVPKLTSPTKCTSFPATNTTKNFTSEFACE